MSNATYPLLLEKLKEYKKKYYRNLLVRGMIISAALILSAFLIINTLEYFGRFDSLIRGALFFVFIALALYAGFHWVIDPALKLLNINKQISNEEAAYQIGRYFKDVNDKLLNAIQLYSLSNSESELIRASIEQKTSQLSVVSFTDAIDLRQNRKYVRYVLPPLLLIFIILFWSPKFFTESSARLLHFNQEYVPVAPFSFVIKNKTLQVFKNEDFTVQLGLEGNTLPEGVYLVSNGRKFKMTSTNGRNYEYTFSKVQKPFDFYFEGSGYNSDPYRVQLISRPNLKLFNANLNYPDYLNRPTEKQENVGNLLVPEGTVIEWEFFSADTDSLLVSFEADKNSLAAQKEQDDVFTFDRKAVKSQRYQVKLKNEHGFNKEPINYFLEVIPDQFPRLSVEAFRDTALFNYLVFGGNIADDYGFSRLGIFYEIAPAREEGANRRKGSVALPINRTQTLQNFSYQWPIDQLKLAPGDRLEYYVQVWDNDGVNGPKATKSSAFSFEIPTEEKLDANLEQSTKQTENRINSALNKASNLKKEINAIEDRLKTKKSLDYQDKKALEELLKKRNELNSELQQLQKQVENLKKQQDRFNQSNPEMNEKVQQLQKLMNELLDEETKKLYDELQKLLENNRNSNELLEKLSKKENTLEKEIERALEMFKQLQFEQKLENQIKELNELSKEQQELSEKTQEKKEDQQQLLQEQQKLNEDFEQNKEEMKELQEMNKSLEESNPMEDTKQEEQEISEKQQESTEQLQKQQNKKASESQKDAAQKMQQMAEKLSQMQNSMEMEQAQENLDDLRDILENLITLSFDQEQLMKDFRNVNQSDPRFQNLSQEQLKLKDDAKIIEDSLYSLAKRVFQIESFVTREVTSMKDHMDASGKGIKERKMGYVASEQQLAMTSMNNLALLLNDVLKQMQEQMAQAKAGKSGKKNQNKQKSPGMSELQQQLNQRIESLKQSGKSGRELSEELAKMAAEQEMLRRALQEFEKAYKQDKNGKDGNMDELIKKMEETEKDLVNKNLNNQLINRQKEILTRLLESEKSMKEQEEEERRQAQQAKDKPKPVPAQLEQYLKTKENQLELLKTIPPALSPYYKKEVDEYFKKIEK